MKTAAIYARVSSDKQREENTIASQTAALVAFARAQQFEVPKEWIFEDDGYSGANLIRPGLERVRDLAAEGLIQAVLIYAPDRLSRRYAHQILLIEELARAGVETLFVRAPRGSTPEDELLVQFQGMIAEYERAQILERSRRGKRHRAGQGEVSVLSGARFGYPHQFSGGMRQRVMIAIAIACDPKLIIADEPTTALDVTIQAQILELMNGLTRRLNVALIIITHNLGVVARYAKRVNVMYAGRIVESGPAAAIYHDPRHPYTMALLRSVPRLDRPRQALLDPVSGQPPDLTRLDQGCAFRPRCRFAVAACAQVRPPPGEILYEGVALTKLKHKQLGALRRRIKVIFQDPYSSLNPRMKVGDIIAEPMKVHAIEPDAARRAARVRELLAICGLSPNFVDRYPHEMSGGQRQRVGIARALALNPEFIICDEAVSALDVSIHAQIVNLLEDLRERFVLTYLFIAHGLSVLRPLGQRLAVMLLGRIVELADCDELFDNALHPYTRALLASVPLPAPRVEARLLVRPPTRHPPSPINPPPGSPL